MGKILKGNFGSFEKQLNTEPIKDKKINFLTADLFRDIKSDLDKYKKPHLIPDKNTKKADPKIKPIDLNNIDFSKPAEVLAAEILGKEAIEELTLLVDSTDKATEVLKFLSSLAEIKPSREIMANAEQYWSSKNTKELSEALFNSTETEWQTKPGLYLGLVKEIRNRLGKSVLNE